jgi:hypothetical protein
VSADYFLVRFEQGENVELDHNIIRPILEPLVTERDEWSVTLSTPDGGTTIFGWDDTEAMMLSNVGGAAMWSTLVELLVAGGMVLVSGWSGTFVADAAITADLPDGLPEPVWIVTSGAELQRAIETV